MFFTEEQLENLADNINMRYFPQRLHTAIELDAYDLIDALGCNIDWKYISFVVL